ncbi:biotin/lipoyl-binding protein [Escherichia coli]
MDEGDAIKAGQVLGELDHKPYEIALMQAKRVFRWHRRSMT